MGNNFEKDISDEKEKIINTLKSRLELEKLKLVKAELIEDGIEFSEDVESISELKSDIKHRLSKMGYKSVIAKIDRVSDSLDKLVDDLEKGSNNSLQKFLSNAYSFVKPVSKAAVSGMASRAAIILAPTVASKLVVTGAIMANSVYKIVRSKKMGNIVSQEAECNKILQELEITKNSDGIVIDTRFSKDIQIEIKNFLTSRNISYLDTGYLSLRQALFELGFEDKKELCSIINNRLGRSINVKERIASKKYSFFKSFGKNTAVVGAGTASGVGVATAVNSIDPAIISAPLNGTAFGLVMNELTNSKALSGILGTVGGVGSGLLEYVPVVGEAIENAFALENILSCGVIGAGIGVSSILVGSVVKTIKNAHNQFSFMKNQKSILEFDSEKYKKDNETEFLAMKEVISKENSPAEQVIFDLIYQYMDEELGIKFEQVPTTLSELRGCIKKCSVKERSKICSFAERLKEANNKHSDFINTLIKIEKSVTTATALGLAGLSVYDIVKDGTVIPEISRKIFKDVPNNVYLMIPEKPEISKINYNGDVATMDNNLSMVEDISKAKDTYTELESMQKETTVVGEVIDKAKQDVASAGSDIADGSFWDRLKDGVSEFMADPKGEVKERFDKVVGFGKDIVDKVTNPKETFDDAIQYITEAKYVPDTPKIVEAVNGLSQDELIDLAYYYNLSDEVDKTTEVYQAIGNVLQQKLNIIQEGIKDYNDMMRAIDTTSDALTLVGTSSEVVAEVSGKRH